jgi:hypothetical protein
MGPCFRSSEVGLGAGGRLKTVCRHVNAQWLSDVGGRAGPAVAAMNLEGVGAIVSEK